MNAVEIVKALGGQWHGSYGIARCPAHDDQTPSLSVSERDGKLLVKCHAGCDQADVWAALQDRGFVGNGDNSERRYRPRCTEKGPADHDTDANSTFAKRIWTESRPAKSSPVETYLRSRALTIEPRQRSDITWPEAQAYGAFPAGNGGGRRHLA